MDGHDVRTVEIQQCQVQESCDVGALDAELSPAFEEINSLGVWVGVPTLTLALCEAQCGPQGRTDAIAQLARRRDGERHYQ